MTNSHFVLGVHLMLLMAKRGKITSELAAESIRSNAVFLRRLLCQLAKAGLVVTQTGPSGGSQLARPATEITLGDIYAAVEPDSLFGLHAQTPNPQCTVGRRIQNSLSPILTEAEAALRQVLSSKTLAQHLAELMAETQE